MSNVKILIVDDEKTNRMVLKAMLHKDGFDTVMAENGQEAIEQFEQERPDMVLMDVMMPVMDGYDATIKIKKLAGDTFVPVFFLTAMTDEAALAKCVEVGGDDFLTKPYNRIILKAKIDALLRVKELYGRVKSQKDQLAVHNNYIKNEHEFAKRIFTKIIKPETLHVENIKYLLSPMAIFNGDLLLACPKPSGGQHFMLGDFTGHGLPAAIGALPVAEIFYGMTDKGFSVSDIVTEINDKLVNILPTGVFMAACFLDIDSHKKTLSIWNGGLPDVIVFTPGQGIMHRLDSDHLPLGIQSSGKIDTAVRTTDIHYGDRIYVYSDGVIEAGNKEGEMYGQERLEQCIVDSDEPGAVFQNISASLDAYRAGKEQEDDITLIEITADPDLLPPGMKEIGKGVGKSSTEWKISVELGPDSLQVIDPLPSLLHQVLEIQSIYPHRGRIYTILAELYTNALEHGVLGLDAKMKQSPEGFAQFYMEREKRIQNLDKGFVKIIISNKPYKNGGKMTICYKDSGKGFDVNSISEDTSDATKFSGRGVALVRSLCENVTYTENGTSVEAVYIW